MTDTAPLEVTRTVPSSRNKVWNAWTTVEGLAQWWWPESFRTEYHVDPKAGGSYRFRAPDVPGVGALEVAGVFRDVDPVDLLRFTWRWEPELSVESLVEVRFAGLAGGTEIHLTHTGLEDDADVQNHHQGWNDCIDRLEALRG